MGCIWAFPSIMKTRKLHLTQIEFEQQTVNIYTCTATDDEEDYVIEMFQQATMAVAEPHIAMAVMNGISGFDSE